MFGEGKLLMTMELIALDQEKLKNEVDDWYTLTRLLIEPTYFRDSKGLVQPYDHKQVLTLLQEYQTINDTNVMIGNEICDFSLHIFKNTLLMKNVIDQIIFLPKQQLIESYITLKMQTSGLFATVRAYDEFLYHNTESVLQRQQLETVEETAVLPKIMNTEGQIIIDCNQFPGYDLFYRGLCFTSCWQMYFSKAYFSIIPKPVFMDLQQVEAVEDWNNQFIQVKLYQNPFNWKHEKNIYFQRLYRDQLGFDHLAWDNGVGILKEPFIEYVYMNKMIQTVQYQNVKMQPVKKKDATFFVTRSYDIEKGITREKRVKGSLNAQAYFPWLDEDNMKMMNYLVLDPTYSLDEGVRAYAYYLKEYLEIDVRDEKYEDYQMILNIYVPSSAITSLPFEKIKQHFPEAIFSKLDSKKEYTQFELTQGKNHLKVVFINLDKLSKTIHWQEDKKIKKV